MKESDLAYIAGVIDNMGIIRHRLVGDTVLPAVFLHTPEERLMSFLASLTDTKVTETRRESHRRSCTEHCKDKHQHVKSISHRWSVTGAKATILLMAIRPYLRMQGYAADEAIEAGLRASFKPKTAMKMRELGWKIPEEWTEYAMVAEEEDVFA